MSGMQKQQQQQKAKATAKAKKQEQKGAKQVNVQQMMEAPETLRSEDVLAAQRQVGNQVVQRALSPGARDAAVTDEQGNLKPDIASKISQKRGGGAPLPGEVQKEARKALGKDFGNVRIHTDETADKLSRTISARAFTIGSDIFFKQGVFSPGTSKGRETLMHELTHVVQQSGSKSTGGKLKLGAPGTAMEQEADRTGKKLSSGATVGTGAPGTVQKQSADEEELQMQAEEEELQMQAEEEELQMQEDEEELQMQPEEEELQMQPDVGNTVQREDDDLWTNGRLNYKKYSQNVLGGHRIAPGISKQVEMFGGSIGQHRNVSETKAPQKPAPKRTMTTRPKPQVTVQSPQSRPTKSQEDDTESQPPRTESQTSNTAPETRNSGTKPPLKRTTGTRNLLGTNPETVNSGTKPPLKRTTRSRNLTGTNPETVNLGSTVPKPDPQVVNPEEPTNTIPEAPTLPVQQKKAQEGPLSFSDQIKAKAKGMHTNSQRENLAKLEQDRGEKTGKRVSEQFKEDQANKPKSKWQKFKGLAKSAGSKALGFGKLAGMAALGKAGSVIKGQLTQAKDQFFGKSEEKEEKPSPVTVNVGGGGGGGGGGGMAETISDLFQENKKLKAQIAELEKEKA